ncbi:MAG: rsfS [Proteobacteria bacterium]|nr:rsfS [Pseudomonadota bacterium]
MNPAQTTPAVAGIASSRPLPSAGSKRAADSETLHALVLQSLDDDQAQDVISIALEGKSSIADYMVVASGRSTRQVASMAQKLAERIKAAGFGSSRIEGLPAADWVLIDAGDVVVHLFRPEVRSFYNLERMWAFGDAPPVAAGQA